MQRFYLNWSLTLKTKSCFRVEWLNLYPLEGWLFPTLINNQEIFGTSGHVSSIINSPGPDARGAAQGMQETIFTKACEPRLSRVKDFGLDTRHTFQGKCVWYNS